MMRHLWRAGVLCAASCGGPASGGQTADTAQAATTRDSLVYVSWSLPDAARIALARGAYRERYEVFHGLNPYYQRGQFDGDSVMDVAVQVRERSTGRRGIAMVSGADSSVTILGAGVQFGNGGDDFAWLWVWRPEPRQAGRDAEARAPDVLYVEKPESAGGIIWWDGKGYRWTQHGD